jgi:hypothetical protein
MYTSPQFGSSSASSGIGGKSLDALRVQLFKMNSQQLQAFAMANQDDAVKLGLAAEADKVHKQHTQEQMALMSGQQPQPPVAQQILQSIGQPPQQPHPPQGQPQQGMPPQQPQGQGQGPMPPQGMPPQGMPPPQPQEQMPPQGHAAGGYMLPEDQGIATLPVGNMDFAQGGIIAFGNGGDVPVYKQGGTPLSTYVDKYAQEYNLDPSVLSHIVQAESEGKTTAKNPASTAHGAGQLLDNMWNKVGGGDRKDAETQVRNAAKLLRSNTDNFKNATGREPSASEAYTTWVLGDSTGRAVLSASPNASVEDVIKKADPKHADDIIEKNSSLFKNKSVADVMQWATTKTSIPPLVPVASAQAAAAPALAQSSAKTSPLADLLPQNNEPYHPLEEFKKNVTGAFNVAKQVPSNLYDVATSPAEYFKNIDTKNLGPAIIGGFNPSHIGKAGVPGTPAKPIAAPVVEPAAPVVEPAAPTVTETVVSDAVKAAREKQAAARAAVQTQVGAPKPAPLSAVEAAQAKQAAAKQGLQTLLPDNTNPAPTFPITPESLAARDAAAARLKAAQPEPAPAEGQTFPIAPESEGLAAIQRGKINLERQAEEARKAAAAEEPAVKPAEEPAVKPAEEPAAEEPAAEVPPVTEPAPTDIPSARKNLVPPMPSGGIASAAPDYRPPFMPDAMTRGSTNVDIPSPEELEKETGKSSEELKKQANNMGMDLNSFLLRFGLGMMAGKSPHALVNVGEAGLGALQMASAEKKAAAEQAYHEALAEQARAHAAYYPGLLAQKMAGLDVKQRIAVETETARLMAPYRNNPMYYGNLAALQQMESNVREGVMNRILGQNQPAAGAAPVTVPQDVTVKQIR